MYCRREDKFFPSTNYLPDGIDFFLPLVGTPIFPCILPVLTLLSRSLTLLIPVSKLVAVPEPLLELVEELVLWNDTLEPVAAGRPPAPAALDPPLPALLLSCLLVFCLFLALADSRRDVFSSCCLSRVSASA